MPFPPPGVPLLRPVAGVAVGAMLLGSRSQLLLDLKGVEDMRGNMDMKVAGTRSGVTAMQLDVKLNTGRAEGTAVTAALGPEGLLQALELVRCA